MRYLSLFSGVEMASLAFKPLGWTPVAFAEIDPFACAVLAHHHPDVPNLGDVAEISDETVAALAPDFVVFGSPCTDFSHAGKRLGMFNEDGTLTRSGLFLHAMRLVRASGAGRFLFENVPGMLSTNGGVDFGIVIAEILGCSFPVPKDGWQAAGAAVGPRGSICWRTLDAQWFSLAQRRERVFVVGDLREGANTAPVFPLLESVPRNPPACVAARQRPPRRATGRPRRKSIWEQIADAFRAGGTPRSTQVARTLGAVHGGADEHDAEAGRLIPSVTPLLETGKRAGKKGSKKDGSGIGNPGDPMFTLGTDSRHGVALAYGGNNTAGPIEVSTCLNAKGGASRMDFESETLIVPTTPGGVFDEAPSSPGPAGQPIAFHARQDPDCSGEVTHPLDTDGTSIGIAFDTTQITSGENRCQPRAGDPCHPLSATAHPPAYATMYEVRRLLPAECAKLQGVPDTYLDILYRGKPAADGPKYKSLGNGFPVTVIRWIAERIEACDRGAA